MPTTASNVRIPSTAALLLCACTKSTAPVTVGASVEPPTVVVEQTPEPPKPTISTAEAELDRTIWDCEWSIVVFWGPHLHWAHRDAAMAVMGTRTLFTREDLELSYGPERSFAAALRRREYPNGQRETETHDGPLQPYAYSIEGRRLTISAAHWTDGPLECAAGCYDQAFIDFMDARYGTVTEASAVTDKMSGGGCGL